jgi:2-polyprenyl-3-methyl-5-hydroxy-6-metoxy-1,4-benzoquinol methylase
VIALPTNGVNGASSLKAKQRDRYGWIPINLARTKACRWFALLVLAAEPALGASSRIRGSERFGTMLPIVIVLAIVAITVFAIKNRKLLAGTAKQAAQNSVSLPDVEKERLIRENEELVIDAEKPPLSREGLLDQLQQLRLVLYQAQRYSTPTYFLDAHLSVIHWNVAFELIFRPILPRIRRRHVNYFIAELENHDAVFNHARDFTDQVKRGELPLADVEPLIYNSADYGAVEVEKVATQLTDTEGNLKAWSVALFFKRINWDVFGPDLLKRVRDDKLWGIYAASYDAVLLEFTPYRLLIEEVIKGIPADAKRVLELGAGTGNVTASLLRRGYQVTATENNPLMLEKMSAKNLRATGRLTINMESVEDTDLGDEGNYDAVVAVNVVYALENPAKCFQKVFQALKAGGTFVFSTTHSGTSLDLLLEAIAVELRTHGSFKAKEEHYRRVVSVNKDIECRLARRYSREQYETWLVQLGFEILHSAPSYVGAVVVIHARKA